MRQAGVIAACGVVALEDMVERLKEDHDNAKYLGGRLNEIPGIYADMDRIQINMVFWKTDIKGFTSLDSWISWIKRARRSTGYLQMNTALSQAMIRRGVHWTRWFS